MSHHLHTSLRFVSYQSCFAFGQDSKFDKLGTDDFYLPLSLSSNSSLNWNWKYSSCLHSFPWSILSMWYWPVHYKISTFLSLCVPTHNLFYMLSHHINMEFYDLCTVNNLFLCDAIRSSVFGSIYLFSL